MSSIEIALEFSMDTSSDDFAFNANDNKIAFSFVPCDTRGFLELENINLKVNDDRVDFVEVVARCGADPRCVVCCSCR
ncbi:hypothetical protein JYU34_016148 [Plutella xylostella]|uniref:Uncharacterized protein n=1 Tax=Plutella xylostella TaxID=51655 RepID=A0ABQ7Q5K2_PLUXY|nr:hypothetical protein JYU34_016148 [Plutella xylostella]